MAGIKSKDTKPELQIRSALHRRGYRYTLHNKKLFGKPDLCLKKYKVAIFINGCFWHAHNDCHLFRLPKSKVEFWEQKLTKNKLRDKENIESLGNDGWRILLLWECALKGKQRLDFESLIETASKWIESDSTWLEIRGNTKANQDIHYRE